MHLNHKKLGLERIFCHVIGVRIENKNSHADRFAMLDLSVDRSIRKVMERVEFALINRPC